jgi:hypothetical protein
VLFDLRSQSALAQVDSCLLDPVCLLVARSEVESDLFAVIQTMVRQVQLSLVEVFSGHSCCL